jgi:DNA invertase Pin-like site-specific DNA recombinase
LNRRLSFSTETIDATTPGERRIFHIFGALWQIERDLADSDQAAGI